MLICTLMHCFSLYSAGRKRSPLMRDSRQLQHRNVSPTSERQSPSAFTFSNFAPGMQTAVAAFAIPRHHIAADNSVFTAYGRGTDSVAGSVAGSVASPVERGRQRLHSFDELPASIFETASPAAAILSASELQKRRRGQEELDNHPEEAGNDFAAAAAVGNVPDQVPRANESAVSGPTSVKPKAVVARPVTKLQQAKRARFSHIRAMFACQRRNDEEGSEEEAGAVADTAGAVVNVSGLGPGGASPKAGEAGHAAASVSATARRAGQMLPPPSHRPDIGAAAGNGTASDGPTPGQAPQPPTTRPQPRQTFRISPIKPRGSAPPSTPSTAAVANSAARTAAAHASGNGSASRHTSVAAAAETSRPPGAGAAGAAGGSGGAVAGFTLTTGRGALERARLATASGASAVDGDGDAEMITAARLEDEMMLVADRQQPLPLAIVPAAAPAAAAPQQKSVIASVANVALAALASIGISMIGNGEDDGKANTTAAVAGSAVGIASAARRRLTGASIGDDGTGEEGNDDRPWPRADNVRSAGIVNTAAKAGGAAAAADPNIVDISIRIGPVAAATTTSGASSAGSTGSSGGSTDSSIITITARQTDSIPSIKHRLTHAYFPPQVLHHVLGYWGWELRLAMPSSALSTGGSAAGAAGVGAGSMPMQVMIGASGAGSDSSTSSSSNSFSSIPDTMTVAGLIQSIEMAHAISGSPASAASCGAPSSPSPASASCLRRNPVTGQLHLDLTAELITLI